MFCASIARLDGDMIRLVVICLTLLLKYIMKLISLIQHMTSVIPKQRTLIISFQSKFFFQRIKDTYVLSVGDPIVKDFISHVPD